MKELTTAESYTEYEKRNTEMVKAMNESALEVYTTAREIFRDHGTAIGVFRNQQGNVCAVGALSEALTELYNRDENPVNGYRMGHYLIKLNAVAASIHRMRCAHCDEELDLIDVNDRMGAAAVLDVYDAAIKELESHVE